MSILRNVIESYNKENPRNLYSVKFTDKSLKELHNRCLTISLYLKENGIKEFFFSEEINSYDYKNDVGTRFTHIKLYKNSINLFDEFRAEWHLFCTFGFPEMLIIRVYEELLKKALSI